MGFFMITIVLVWLVLALIFLLLPVLAVIDILRSKFEGNENILMLLLVIFVPFGAIIYFLIGPSRKIRFR